MPLSPTDEKIFEYVISQDKQNKKIDKSLNNQKWILAGLGLLLCFLVYIVTEAPTPTERDMKDIQKDRQQLINQRKFFVEEKDDFQKEKDNFQKEKAIFVILKIKTDSANAALQQENVKLMAAIFKQDSIARLKQVIKADVVNAGTVNTVNAGSVNVKPNLKPKPKK